jgi:hypothetical protein
MNDLEHSPGWIAANRAIWFLGTAIVAAHGVALLLYGAGARAAAEEAAQRQVTVEHAAICEKLGRLDGSPGREQCLTLLLQLQQRHEQFYIEKTNFPL